MANKVYNMEGGLHSAAAYSAFENSMWGSCVASSSDFVATAGTGMNISLSAGNGMIDTGLGFSRRIASDAVNTISVDAASSANPRKDALVAYIDNGVTPTTSVLDNTNDILKFACVAGNPAATPAAPSDAAIQTAIGAGNPYVVLWYVTVPKSATSLSTATFTDNRNISSKIDGSNIKDGTVTASKIDYATINDKIAPPMLNLRQLGALEPMLPAAVGDNGSVSVNLGAQFPDCYIFINSHINVREIIMLMRMGTSRLEVDPIFRSGTFKSEFSMNGSVLSITGAPNCSGMLYLLRQAKKPA